MESELSPTDVGSLIERNQSYYVWSPHEAFEAAAALLQALDAEWATTEGLSGD